MRDHPLPPGEGKDKKEPIAHSFSPFTWVLLSLRISFQAANAALVDTLLHATPVSPAVNSPVAGRGGDIHWKSRVQRHG